MIKKKKIPQIRGKSEIKNAKKKKKTKPNKHNSENLVKDSKIKRH